jgi:hypothetical protein
VVLHVLLLVWALRVIVFLGQFRRRLLRMTFKDPSILLFVLEAVRQMQTVEHHFYIRRCYPVLQHGAVVEIRGAGSPFEGAEGYTRRNRSALTTVPVEAV